MKEKEDFDTKFTSFVHKEKLNWTWLQKRTSSILFKKLFFDEKADVVDIVKLVIDIVYEIDLLY